MSPGVEQIAHALDRTARREKLLEEARGTWRLGWNDFGSALAAGVFLYSYFQYSDPRSLGAAAIVVLVWRDKRIESRLDAVVRLLEREA